MTKLLGTTQGWWVAVNDEFNRYYYPELVGKAFKAPPAYCHVIWRPNR